jgi:hypothetical protein
VVDEGLAGVGSSWVRRLHGDADGRQCETRACGDSQRAGLLGRGEFFTGVSTSRESQALFLLPISRFVGGIASNKASG